MGLQGFYLAPYVAAVWVETTELPLSQPCPAVVLDEHRQALGLRERRPLTRFTRGRDRGKRPVLTRKERAAQGQLQLAANPPHGGIRLLSQL